MKLIKCMICSVNYFLFFHIFTYLGVSCIVNIQEYFHGTFLDITIFLFHYIHRRLLNMTLTRQSHPIWPIRGKSKSDARKSNLVDFTVLRCNAVCVWRVTYAYTFSRWSSLESAVRRSAMLTTAQPNGRLYCTLHMFFFSPAPILPTHTTISAHHMHAGSLASVIIQSRNVSFYQS